MQRVDNGLKRTWLSRRRMIWHERQHADGRGKEPNYTPGEKAFFSTIHWYSLEAWNWNNEATFMIFIGRGDISTNPIPSDLKCLFWERWKTNISTTTLDYAFDVDKNLIPNEEEILRHSENLNYFFSKKSRENTNKNFASQRIAT